MSRDRGRAWRYAAAVVLNGSRGHRRSWSTRIAVLSLCAGCTFNSGGAGGGGADDATSADTESPATSTADGGPGPSSQGATGDTTPATTAGETSTGATSAATTTATNTDTEGDPNALWGDDALVVRYYLDEAAEGPATDSLLDAGPPPVLDLIAEYNGQWLQPRYVADGGHRGLRWDMHGGGGRGEVAASGTKLAALDGGTEVSFEFVIEVTSVFMTTEPFARLLVWQPDVVPHGIEMGVLAAWDDVASDFSIDLRASWQPGGGLPIGRWPLAGTSGRVVVHLVIDTSGAAGPAARLFANGVEVPAQFLTEPPVDAPILVSDDARLVLGNRPADNASFGGAVYYAAVYDRALGDDEVSHNAAQLAVDDDTP
jgi:hypothetical protein